MGIRQSFFSRAFDFINIVLLFVVAAVTVIPFIYILAGSLSDPAELLKKGFILFPTKFSLAAYKYIFSADTILNSLRVTIFITLMGTFVNLVFTSLTAYGLSRRGVDGRRVFMFMIVFSMLFSGGMIPTFLVVKELGMIDSYAALFIPSAISGFNLIVMKNFFQAIPYELEESARIDGCNDIGILFRIVLPLSMPALATFSLFYSVGHWNTFFGAIMYINDSSKWPIQVILRQLVILNQSNGIGDSSAFEKDYVLPPPETIKMAVIIVSTLPIMLVYPFLQKHFAKGVLLGSVKG